MGQAPTRIVFFLKFCVFVLCFVVVHVSKKIEKLDRGRVGGVWSIRVFLGFLDFFMTRPFSIGLLLSASALLASGSLMVARLLLLLHL